ncbi:MAG: hypothetical protein IKX21_00740 [Deltaproteobacteria bacterium]|nr:hypothetical protein [Deltaproteobacteria bacterium]
MSIRQMFFCLALLGAFSGGILISQTGWAKEIYPVKGEVLVAQPFQDKLGSGAIVYSHFRDNETTSTLHVYRFNKEKGKLVKIWQINDGIQNCKHDCAYAAFTDENEPMKKFSPIITDLDGNGLKEIWTGYVYSCTDEFGPSCDGSASLKIIMYEGKKKYAMRGDTQWCDLGGRGTMDAAFKSGPEVFRLYAQKLWNRWRVGGPEKAFCK